LLAELITVMNINALFADGHQSIRTHTHMILFGNGERRPRSHRRSATAYKVLEQIQCALPGLFIEIYEFNQ
jgi:hypothetical protein